MKKISKFLVFLFAIMMAVPICLPTKLTANAATEPVSLTNFSSTISTIIDEYSVFTERVAGSENEKKASEYIHSYLESKTSFEAVDNAHIKNGVQTFQFESEFSNIFETSQNIIYQLISL